MYPRFFAGAAASAAAAAAAAAAAEKLGRREVARKYFEAFWTFLISLRVFDVFELFLTFFERFWRFLAWFRSSWMLWDVPGYR